MKLFLFVQKSEQNQQPDSPRLNITKCLIMGILVVLCRISSAQVGVQTDNPDPSSILDIVSSEKGILIPRVSLTADLASPSPVTAPATGLLVFNSGNDQPAGFYYWTGTEWEALSANGQQQDSWLTTGNNLINADIQYLGTNDSADLVLRTVAMERLRVNDRGQVLVGSSEPVSDSDLFSVVAGPDFQSAINSYSNNTGIYSSGTAYGLISVSEDSTGFPVYAKNRSVDGYGGIFVGSNGSAYTLTDHSSGISSHGHDGVFTTGIDQNEGIGIIAGGNNVQTLSTINTGAGGAFTGYHGVYSHATDRTEGCGMIGVGNDHSDYVSLRDGSGGSFTGFHGILGYATDESNGTGIVGAGNGEGYYMMEEGYGGGGAFTGKYIGLAGWADEDDDRSVGVLGQYYGFGGWSDGIGVKGIAHANNNYGYGVYGEGNWYGVFANGDFGASGSKAFVIDHPLDPENKILKHYSMESPEVLNLYRGNATLGNGGEIVITLPAYFLEVNTNFSYMLTPIGSKAPGLYISKEIDDSGTFTVAGGDPGQKFSWVVYAERNDPYMQAYPESKAVEINKKDEKKGLYLRPELYGSKREKGMFYQPKQNKIEPKRNEVIRRKAGVVKDASKKDKPKQ